MVAIKRWKKCRKDYNGGKNGWVSGNPRYNRAKPTCKMGRN